MSFCLAKIVSVGSSNREEERPGTVAVTAGSHAALDLRVTRIAPESIRSSSAT